MSSNDDMVTFCHTYERRLLRYVITFVRGDYFLARDIVQESLLRAWKHSKILESDNALPWLHVVARRLCIDRWRVEEKNARSIPFSPEVLEKVIPSDNSVECECYMVEMYSMIARLTPEHRTVVVDVYLKGVTAREEATNLGISIGTVKSRLFYAREQLRGMLQSC